MVLTPVRRACDRELRAGLVLHPGQERGVRANRLSGVTPAVHVVTFLFFFCSHCEICWREAGQQKDSTQMHAKGRKQAQMDRTEWLLGGPLPGQQPIAPRGMGRDRRSGTRHLRLFASICVHLRSTFLASLRGRFTRGSACAPPPPNQTPMTFNRPCDQSAFFHHGKSAEGHGGA